MSCCSRRSAPVRPPVLLKDQSENLKGADHIHVSKLYKDAKNEKFMSFLTNEVQTLYESFNHGSYASNNGPCLGWRESLSSPYQWMTYDETLLRAKNFGSGLLALGLSPGKNTFICLYSHNRPEWILCEQGCYTQSMVLVPLSDTLGPQSCSFIINQTGTGVVIVEDDKKVNSLLDWLPTKLSKLIVINPLHSDTLRRIKNSAIQVYTFDEVENLGSISNIIERPPVPEDLCTICYTSGTTGNPKGVMLSHRNVMACIASVFLQLGEHKPQVGDVLISFLPLSHMLERTCENALFYAGGSVGFYSGNIKDLANDLKALKPTIMPAVPRLLNRVYDKMHLDINGSPFKKFFYHMAIKSKEADLKRFIIRRNSLWDVLLFKRVQESFGGRLRLMVVGSAPLAGHVLTFIRCSLGCIVAEGFGMTEAVAPVTLTVLGDHVTGHVGPPLPCCGIKLVDIPEMGYFMSNNQGEICIKGTSVFKGYFKEPERTATAFDASGWLHTGDVGEWNSNGTLSVIDRKKHIFKLSQGEYIIPEKIEGIYQKSSYVYQVFVYGESLKSCIIAIVVPRVENLKEWAVQNNIPGTLSVLCNNAEVKTLIMDDMNAIGKEYGLKSYEQVKDIYLHPDPFSINNNLLTAALKSRREQIRNYFKPQLDDMYQNLK
ncbi:CLUMA_CG001619, isoform A [Clunio marinus]|uniref:Long-chain-fatty-acid--CoA ligase n=1 Tax=Clunio marinus TaxID=568069 RepID=A0A1J1HIG3_9DIPT|nr:CLUMA_CG001619, isoform A [Clunio marinus]